MDSTARRKDLKTLEWLVFPTTEERRKHVLDVRPLILATHFLNRVNPRAASTREKNFWKAKAMEIQFEVDNANLLAILLTKLNRIVQLIIKEIMI